MKMEKAGALVGYFKDNTVSVEVEHKICFNKSFLGKEDSDIWTSFKKGDEEAFLYIYNKYFYDLMNYGIQFSQDTELLKDCIQDLFISLRKKRESLGNISYSIKSYLFKSIKRSIIKKLAKIKSTTLRECQNAEDGFEVQISTETEIINSQLSREVKSQLKLSINKLPKKQREAILYYYYEGFTYEEITAIMEFSRIEYARITVSNGIKKLRKEMAKLKPKIFEIIILFCIYLYC